MAHHGVCCDLCDRENFHGVRYKCLECFDFDLCAKCYERGVEDIKGHPNTHPMQCIFTPVEFDLFYGGETHNYAYCHSLTCPLCAAPGFTAVTLVEHIRTHTFDEPHETLCPLCAQISDDDPNFTTEDLASHLSEVHIGVNNASTSLYTRTSNSQSNNEGGASCDQSSHVTTIVGEADRAGDEASSSTQRLTTIHHGGMRSSSNALSSSSSAARIRLPVHLQHLGLSRGALAPSLRLRRFNASWRDAMDPITELLSQLTTLRRTAVTSAAATPSSLGPSRSSSDGTSHLANHVLSEMNGADLSFPSAADHTTDSSRHYRSDLSAALAAIDGTHTYASVVARGAPSTRSSIAVSAPAAIHSPGTGLGRQFAQVARHSASSGVDRQRRLPEGAAFPAAVFEQSTPAQQFCAAADPLSASLNAGSLTPGTNRSHSPKFLLSRVTDEDDCDTNPELERDRNLFVQEVILSTFRNDFLNSLNVRDVDFHLTSPSNRDAQANTQVAGNEQTACSTSASAAVPLSPTVPCTCDSTDTAPPPPEPVRQLLTDQINSPPDGSTVPLCAPHVMAARDRSLGARDPRPHTAFLLRAHSPSCCDTLVCAADLPPDSRETLSESAIVSSSPGGGVIRGGGVVSRRKNVPLLLDSTIRASITTRENPSSY